MSSSSSTGAAAAAAGKEQARSAHNAQSSPYSVEEPTVEQVAAAAALRQRMPPTPSREQKPTRDSARPSQQHADESSESVSDDDHAHHQGTAASAAHEIYRRTRNVGSQLGQAGERMASVAAHELAHLRSVLHGGADNYYYERVHDAYDRARDAAVRASDAVRRQERDIVRGWRRMQARDQLAAVVYAAQAVWSLVIAPSLLAGALMNATTMSPTTTTGWTASSAAADADHGVVARAALWLYAHTPAWLLQAAYEARRTYSDAARDPWAAQPRLWYQCLFGLAALLVDAAMLALVVVPGYWRFVVVGPSLSRGSTVAVGGVRPHIDPIAAVAYAAYRFTAAAPILWHALLLPDAAWTPWARVRSVAAYVPMLVVAYAMARRAVRQLRHDISVHRAAVLLARSSSGGSDDTGGVSGASRSGSRRQQQIQQQHPFVALAHHHQQQQASVR